MHDDQQKNDAAEKKSFVPRSLEVANPVSLQPMEWAMSITEQDPLS